MDKDFFTTGRNVLYNVFLWALLNTLFGLTPLWFILSGKLFKIQIEYQDIIKDGVIAFFCIAIVASVLIDFLISKLSYTKIVQLVIYVTPFILAGVVYVLFTKCQSTQATKEVIIMFKKLQMHIVWVSILYCLTIKFALYLNEEKKNL
jgi:hypothetical protein